MKIISWWYRTEFFELDNIIESLNTVVFLSKSILQDYGHIDVFNYHDAKLINQLTFERELFPTSSSL